MKRIKDFSTPADILAEQVPCTEGKECPYIKLFHAVMKLIKTVN